MKMTMKEAQWERNPKKGMFLKLFWTGEYSKHQLQKLLNFRNIEVVLTSSRNFFEYTFFL